MCGPGGLCGRWWTKLRKHIVWAKDLFDAFSTKDIQVIYGRFNPVTTAVRMIYVGQTIRPRVRDDTHLRDGSVWGNLGEAERRHPRASYVLFSDQLTGTRGGGPGFWIDMPLAVYPNAVPKHALDRVERLYITLLGTTNVRHAPHSRGLAQIHAAGKAKCGTRGRPARCIRGEKRVWRGLERPHTVTMYRWRDTITPDLMGILYKLQDPANLPASVHCVNGQYNVTNLTSVRRLFGKTAVGL